MSEDMNYILKFVRLQSVNMYSEVYSHGIVDRVLAFEPHTYPQSWHIRKGLPTCTARCLRKHHACMQNQHACKITLKQFPAALNTSLEDFNMAVKLGLEDAKTLNNRATAHVHMVDHNIMHDHDAALGPWQT